MDLESCWCSGLVAAKIDLRKAFDMTHRPALLDLLWRRLGDGPVYRNWHALLSETSALLVTEWGSSFLQLDRGIRQGAVESPALFSALAEDCLLTCQARFRWARAPKAFPELLEEILFMEDGVLWSRSAKGLEIKLEQWARVLLEYGLELNPAKCKVYYSPYATSTAQIKVNGVVIPRVEVLEIMGIPFRVGASSSSLIAPLITRARNKFWSLKHLFRAKTSLPGRLKLMERILGGTALWPVCAIMPDSHALGLLNATQLQLVIWMLRLAKRPTEQWLHFKQRAYRGARQVLRRFVGTRWSTCWLTRFWTYAGHRARGMDKEVPGAASVLCGYRDLEWWLGQKGCRDRVFHPRQHYPKLNNCDRDMNMAVGGLPWRVVARDRDAWKSALPKWVAAKDLPWSRGRQDAIDC